MGNAPSTQINGRRSSLVDSAHGHQHEETTDEKSKPKQLEQPAFSGYVAGWRQGSFDSDAQEMEFHFAQFQPEGYDGDDEDTEVPLESPKKTNLDDITFGQEICTQEKSVSPERTTERTGRSAVRNWETSQLRRPKGVSPSKRSEKRMNSSHGAVIGVSASAASVGDSVRRDRVTV